MFATFSHTSLREPWHHLAMLQLLLLLLGPDGAVKGSDLAAPLKGPNPEDSGDALYDHLDDGDAPKLDHFLSNVRKVKKHSKKGASSDFENDAEGDAGIQCCHMVSP